MTPNSNFNFENPSRRFLKWLHIKNNAVRIQDELRNGYNQEEFEIEDEGEWIINIKYLGNRTPGNNHSTFLKYSIQYNFGKPSQRIEERIVRLSKKGDEQLLTKLWTN
jgi:hypothetical protein